MAAPLGPAGRGRGKGMALVIYDNRIHAMNNPTGIVGRYIRGKTLAVQAEAKARCPVRTGALRESIDVRLTLPSGPNGSLGIVSAGGPFAWYALAVLKGTTGPIHAHFGNMWVPKYRGSAERAWRYEVDGQPANDFLGEALASVMRGSKAVNVGRVTEFEFGPPL